MTHAVIPKKIDDELLDLEILLDEVLKNWPEDVLFSTREILSRYPVFGEYRQLLIEIAFEEYQESKRQDHTLSIEKFVKNFPEIELDLYEILQAVKVLYDNTFDTFPNVNELYHGFRLIKLIGVSHISRVYLAKQLDFGERKVVLKLSKVAASEIESLSKLSHPNIIAPLTAHYDCDQSIWAISMPYEGRLTFQSILCNWFEDEFSIFDTIENHVFNINDDIWASSNQNLSALSDGSATYLEFICNQFIKLGSALDYIHSSGIVHSDIKPSNILFSDHGVPKLFDFNLAMNFQHNGSNTPIGCTNLYASPELILSVQGKGGIDKRSDIYSLGMSLLECLVGPCRDFEASYHSRVKNYQAAFNLQNAMISKLNKSNVPRSIQEVILKCLEKQKQNRYKTSLEFTEALKRALNSLEIIRKRRKFMYSVASALLFSATAYAGWSNYSSTPNRVKRGLSFYTSLHYQSAADEFEKIVNREPDNIAAKTCFALSNLKCGKIDIGYRDLARINDKLNSGLSNTLAAYSAILAEIPEKAILFYLDQAIAKNNCIPDNLINKAYCLERRERFEEALHCLSMADQISGIPRHESVSTRSVIELRNSIRYKRPPSSPVIESLSEIPLTVLEKYHFIKLLAYASRFEERFYNETVSKCFELQQAGLTKDQLAPIIDLNPKLKKLFPFNDDTASQVEQVLTKTRYCDPVRDIKSIWIEVRELGVYSHA